MITTKKTPTFTKGEAAVLLQCAPLTINNREKAGKYPQPKRDGQDNRVYSVGDILELMWITNKQIYLKPIVAMLYDKGYTEKADLDTYLTEEFREFQAKLAITTKKKIVPDETESTADSN